jgi:hypothetical protein
VAVSCEHGNESSDYINDREFLNQLNDYNFLLHVTQDRDLWQSLVNMAINLPVT